MTKTTETYFARTLLRVTKPGRTFIRVIIPAFSCRKSVRVRRDLFPRGKGWRMTKHYRFHARVNLDATSPKLVEIIGPFESGTGLRRTKIPIQNPITGRKDWL